MRTDGESAASDARGASHGHGSASPAERSEAASPRRRPSPVPLDQRPAATRARLAEAAAAAPARKRRRSPLGLLPVAFGTIALVLAAAAGVAFIFAPGWFGKSTAETDVGRIPTADTRPVDYISSPRKIDIPAIDAVAPIVSVTTENRELQIPLNPKIAGWWNGGAKPGAAKGTAIIAGHINYAGVTGEFATIGKLRPGNRIYVSGFRGTKAVTLRFTVTAVRTYVKKTLPYKQIFSQKVAGRLAVVTCGGPFDASTGNYEDNIVVFAVPS